MDAYLDHLLDELVAGEAREAWQDVLDRARRSRRRYLAAVAVVAALVLVPASWAVAHAFEGRPAPPAVKSFFRMSNEMSAKIARDLGKREPRAIVSKAHGVIQVKTADGPLDLWAAPARGGGTCQLVAWETTPSHPHTSESGGCYPVTQPPNNLSWSSGGDYWHRNYNVVTGYAYGNVAIVRVTLSNGRSTRLPIVEHLFLGALPQSIHWRRRPRIISLTTRDAHGNLVGYWRRPAR
jgi:hypothetical protein